MKILGIDYGDSRIGVAVSDEGGRLAFDICVVDASKGRGHAVSELLKLKEKYDVQTFVIGLPANMDGTNGDRVAKTEKFAKALLKAAPDLKLYLKMNVLRRNMRTGSCSNPESIKSKKERVTNWPL